MPIEIFISYRRSDAAGHARALHRALAEAFDRECMFFDRESIESGELFPERIRNGVQECRLLLALIGPDWLTVCADGASDGTRRLDDPNDFVRQEISQALAAGKRVIPVLFDDTPVPGRDALPEPLRALLDCDVLHLTGKNYQYEAQLQELIRLACKAGVVPMPARSAAGAASGVVAERDKLVYLCDRSAQDSLARDTLRELLGTKVRRPFVLVVHGRVEELHHAFVERLEEFSLPRVLKGGGLAQGVRFIDVFEPLPTSSSAAFERRFRERLADRLDADMFENDQAIVEVMRQRKLGALVAVLRWRSSEVAGDAAAPLRLLFEYWSKFPDIDNNRALVGCIVCMKYDKSHAEGGFFKRLFGGGGDRAQALRDAVQLSVAGHGSDPRLVWRVLEELPSITVADLDRWVDEVRPHLGRLTVTEEELREIIQGEAQPMEVVLPHLELLVSQQ